MWFELIAREQAEAGVNEREIDVRAELGEEAVVCAQLRDGHLPEARYAWVPLERLQTPHPHDVPEPLLIRRVLSRPVPLSGASRHTRDDGWLLASPRLGSVTRNAGPYLISGGWWHAEVQRAYHFVETQRGDLMWVYLDRRRRRWFLQGTID